MQFYKTVDKVVDIVLFSNIPPECIAHTYNLCVQLDPKLPCEDAQNGENIWLEPERYNLILYIGLYTHTPEFIFLVLYVGEMCKLCVTKTAYWYTFI